MVVVVIFFQEIDDHAYQLGRWVSNLSSSLLPAEVLLDHDGLPPGCYHPNPSSSYLSICQKVPAVQGASYSNLNDLH